MSATQAANPPDASTQRPSTAAVWLAAVRPKTLSAGATPVVVATAIAAADGGVRWWAAVAALLSAAGLQVGSNLFNDYADFARGADTAERLGPARATQRGWLSAKLVLTGAAVAFGVAAVSGGYLVWLGGWPILAVGVAGIVSAVAYTGGPFPLGYHGLGDLFVFLFFGLAAVLGTHYLHTGGLSFAAWLASAAVGALATAILVVNNLRDRYTDAAAGKRTLVVRLGPRFGRLEYATLMVVAYAVPGVAALNGLGLGWLAVYLSGPLAWYRTRQIYRLDGAALNPMLGATAQLGVVYGALVSVGVLL